MSRAHGNKGVNSFAKKVHTLTFSFSFPTGANISHVSFILLLLPLNFSGKSALKLFEALGFFHLLGIWACAHKAIY